MTSSEPAQDPGPGEPHSVPFLELLQIHPVEFTPGRGRLEMTVQRQHLRNLGIMHGGVLATLLDSVMGMSAGGLGPAGHFVVTVQLNINFIRPAWEGETLVATAEVLHSGRQTAVARGEVRTAKGNLVGSASGTFLYVAHTDAERARFPQRSEPPHPAGPGPSPVPEPF